MVQLDPGNLNTDPQDTPSRPSLHVHRRQTPGIHPVFIPVRVTLSVHDTGRPFSTLSSPRPLRITSPLVLETTIAGEVVARQILEPTDPSYNLEKQQIDAL